jgi:tellurite resistance protein TerC
VGIETIGTPLLLFGFLALVVAMLVVDLGVFHRKAHAVGIREALIWSAVWVGLALAFNAAIYHWFGPERALEFLTGYVIEKALSVDNLFVFLVIFGYFKVATSLQHRVLFWGIVGAVVMRAAFIVVGGALLQSFHWIVYVFGGILVLTGVRLLRQGEGEVHPERNLVVRLVARLLPVSPGRHGARFVVREGGRRLVTPLFLALVTVEVSDVVFAVDSIPAVFAITRDPFIVFTSNIFAILGLRSLYFLLAGGLMRLRYLNTGLAAVLVFVGGKMLLADLVKVPIGVSLLVVATLLGGAVAASLARPLRKRTTGPPASGPGPPHAAPAPAATPCSSSPRHSR